MLKIWHLYGRKAAQLATLEATMAAATADVESIQEPHLQLCTILPFKFTPWLRANIAFRTLFFPTPFWARGCKGGSECMRFA